MILFKTKKLTLILKALRAVGISPTELDLALIIENDQSVNELYELAKAHYWNLGL